MAPLTQDIANLYSYLTDTAISCWLTLLGVSDVGILSIRKEGKKEMPSLNRIKNVTRYFFYLHVHVSFTQIGITEGCLEPLQTVRRYLHHPILHSSVFTALCVWSKQSRLQLRKSSPSTFDTLSERTRLAFLRGMLALLNILLEKERGNWRCMSSLQ